MDITIEKLMIEDDREEHISKHNVSIDEVNEIVEGDHISMKGKRGRWLLVGKTNKDRFLTVIVGERKQKNIYGLVTARSSKNKEKSLYTEFTLQKGGVKYD